MGEEVTKLVEMSEEGTSSLVPMETIASGQECSTPNGYPQQENGGSVDGEGYVDDASDEET